jgi:putative phage-type endonuclease
MAAVVLANTEGMNQETWHELRKRGIGGSDVSTIVGLNRYKSRVQLWLEKTGQIKDQEAGEAAYWGTELEPLVAKRFSAETGLKVQKRNAILQHRDYPWMISNLDREILAPRGALRDESLGIIKGRGRGVLECKTANAWLADKWEGSKAPDGYVLQVMHYLAVTGYEWGCLAVLIGGQQYRHVVVQRDEELIRSLIKLEADFWELVRTKQPPEPDGSEACTELLSQLYSTPTKEIVQLGPVAQEHITRYMEAAQAEKEWKQRKDFEANCLKTLLQNASYGLTETHKVSWPSYTSNRIDTDRLKSEHPEIYEKYLTQNTTRRFTIKEV